MSDCAPVSPPAALSKVIVCERGGRWAVGLRRELGEANVRVWETRSLEDCWQSLAESPASFLVLELSLENVDFLLARLTRLSREFPLSRAVVVTERALAAYECLMREAGAIHFVDSSRRLDALAQVALRHLTQAPPPRQTPTECIWASLPWAGA